MLGRLRLQRGDWEGAMQALEYAVTLDQLSAAAFFDYGQAAARLGHLDAARVALERVQKIAPESDYASDAGSLLDELESADGGVQLATYELRTFDGENLRPLIAPEITSKEPTWDDVIDLRIDLGAQYNSNVTLAPSSRELSGQQRDSAQGMGALSLRWAVIHSDVLRFGPSFDTDFTLNERNIDRYDLQSFRPGPSPKRRLTPAKSPSKPASRTSTTTTSSAETGSAPACRLAVCRSPLDTQPGHHLVLLHRQ